jgi:hypothetical protein
VQLRVVGQDGSDLGPGSPLGGFLGCRATGPVEQAHTSQGRLAVPVADRGHIWRGRRRRDRALRRWELVSVQFEDGGESRCELMGFLSLRGRREGT